MLLYHLVELFTLKSWAFFREFLTEELCNTFVNSFRVTMSEIFEKVIFIGHQNFLIVSSG
jgi:hypothetical protein